MKIIGTIFLIAIILLLIAISIGVFDLHIYPKADENKIRVACVGDSITYGFTVPFHFFFNFPALLQRKLGKQYQFGNYGLNDRTAQKSGHKPYCKERAYKESLKFRPNIVIFFLGANDTQDANFKGEEQFIREYKELLDTYRNLETKPKIILCQTCRIYPCPPFLEVCNDCVAGREVPINDCIKKVAEEYRLPLVDLYEPTKDSLSLYSPDHLHPNLKGHRMIAEKIYSEFIKL